MPVILFPFAFLTWRESIIGFKPTEMNYMQVEHNWVSASKRGFRNIGIGYAVGENLGHVKWRMSDEVVRGEVLRTLHSESYDLQKGILQVEEVVVTASTNQIVRQEESRATNKGLVKAVSIFMPDRIEVHRQNADGKSEVFNLVPSAGMPMVQRRFQPLKGEESKDFWIVDGITGTFHPCRAEYAGRFNGNWGVDKYEGNAYRFTCEGKEQTVMLTKFGEIVKISLGGDYSIALMGQTPSRRKE